MSLFATTKVNSNQGYTPFVGGTSFEAAFGNGPRSFDAYYNGEPISLMNAIRLHPGSPEFHWVAALLNSASVDGFPYSSGDIIKLWQDPQIAGQGVTYRDIATFFQNYLES